MSLNPLNELKRRLDDDSTPLPKRLCLAKNVVLSHHFPTAPKETIVATWLNGLSQKNGLTGKQLKNILGWIEVENLTSDLKSEFIQVVSQFLQKNPVPEENIPYILNFLENDRMTPQITQQIDDYLAVIVALLKYLRNQDVLNVSVIQKILNNIVKHYRECKKKLEFIVKFLDGENVETLFTYLGTECHSTVIHVCQNVLFPMNKKSFFVNFLQTLIRKDNIDELMAEKGDNMQSVLKIMSTFFTFPKGRTEKNQKFISDFVEVFVSCFKKESQLIFAFYIMVVNSLNMNQNYIQPAMKMPPIIFEENDDKIKRSLFCKMLEVLLKNEVYISVRLTDTFGEKISKVEIKKNFMSYLQAVMMGQLKLEGKVDKSTLQIIDNALKLDPSLIEQKMEQILPPIMTSKKNSSTVNEAYVETLNCLLEMLFKLSRGTVFIRQILPHIKLCLEASNTEQFELKQKIQECEEAGNDVEKLKSKLVTGKDIFPSECVEVYGKWTSELMFRQNKDLLVNLQKDFEEHCLMMLEEGFVSPSIITLTEVLSSILASFLRYSKMADHTVPKQVAEDFWSHFLKFENECLGKLGVCVLKLNYNPQLALSFLNLSLSVAHLKLLNLKYSHTKLDMSVSNTSNVYDMSTLLPCLSGEQWTTLASKVSDDEASLVIDNLLLAKTIALRLRSKSDKNEAESQSIVTTKTHLINELRVYTNPAILNINGFTDVVFTNLEKTQLKQLAKSIVIMVLNDPETCALKSAAVMDNRSLLNALVLETAKNLAKCFENLEEFLKVLIKNDFNFSSSIKDVNINSLELMEQITCKVGRETVVSKCIDIYRQLPLAYLEESYQLVVIFLLLISKRCCRTKIRKSVDHILLNIFELSPKYPDIYKIFPADTIFSLEHKSILNLLTLKIKTSNNMFVVKSILESAVKKVKTDSDIVKCIVDLLLSQQKSKIEGISCIEYFSEPVFQIICMILPIIAKEKRAITVSTYRSILATLQEKLHKALLKSFKNIHFGDNGSSLNFSNRGVDESIPVDENMLATLNAMGAFSLTLSKYCETTDAEEIKNLDCLWSGLEFFIRNAIASIRSPETKTQHVDSSIQLLNVTLRHIKKLESHTIFQNKDRLLADIWTSVLERLKLLIDFETRVVPDEFAVTLKFLCELSSVECFVTKFVGDLSTMHDLPTKMKTSDLPKDNWILSLHKESKFLWTQILKANLLAPKCVALSKLLAKTCKELRSWIYDNYEDIDMKKRRIDDDDDEVRTVKVADEICDVLKRYLDVISEAVLSAKKITLDYKLLDSIFALQHQIHFIMSCSSSSRVRCEVSWDRFFQLFEGCVAVLNSLIVSREELLEDRWPNYMQCYRALVTCLCERATSQANLDRPVEEKLAEIAHAVEKLTQSLCKRKAHVSRIAAYTVADICSLLEKTGPSKMVRQHMENSAALLLQAADSSYAAAFLRRSLASSPGYVTLANMYTLYKRYHKYVGNA